MGVKGGLFARVVWGFFVASSKATEGFGTGAVDSPHCTAFCDAYPTAFPVGVTDSDFVPEPYPLAGLDTDLSFQDLVVVG